MDRFIQDPSRILAKSQTIQLISKSPSRILQGSLDYPRTPQKLLKMDRLMQDPLNNPAESPIV